MIMITKTTISKDLRLPKEQFHKSYEHRKLISKIKESM